MFESESISTSDFDMTPTLPVGVTPVSKRLTNRNFGRTTGLRNQAFIDHWKQQQRPTDYGEVNEYKRFAYSCANLNSTTVADQQLRLYVKTSTTDKKPRVATKALTQGVYRKLQSRPETQQFLKHVTSIKDVEEVTDHIALDLLQSVNESNFFDEYKLKNYTQLYQEITGNAYWYVKFNVFNVPQAIWLLPSHQIIAKKNHNSNSIIDYYEFHTFQQGITKLNPKNVIAFLMPNLENPYVEGMSPLEASWEDNAISGKLISHESGMLDNRARPDYLISPKTDAGFGSDEAENMERDLLRRFGHGKGGGPYVTEEPIDFNILNWKPSDLARLEIHKWSKVSICNAYGVPPALLESQSINRATLEAAQVQHGRYSIRPRLSANASVLNKRYLPLFDPTGRMFFAYDDPVPEDRDLATKEAVGKVAAGIWTANEAREHDNLEPHKDGDELEAANKIAEKDDNSKSDSNSKSSAV